MKLLSADQIRRIYANEKSLAESSKSKVDIKPEVEAAFLKAFCGNNYYSQSVIAENSGLSIRSVRKCIALFLDDGVIKRINLDRSNRYDYKIIDWKKADKILSEQKPVAKKGVGHARDEIKRIIKENGQATRKELLAMIDVAVYSIDRAIHDFLNDGVMVNNRKGRSSCYKLVS